MLETYGVSFPHGLYLYRIPVGKMPVQHKIDRRPLWSAITSYKDDQFPKVIGLENRSWPSR